ncbi:MAG: hypothetical protein AAFV49_17470, partial [Pseudomonadota bacterium]
RGTHSVLPVNAFWLIPRRAATEQVARDQRFACASADPADWRQPWADWPGTRYEAKALREGRPPHYLTFRRL